MENPGPKSSLGRRKRDQVAVSERATTPETVPSKRTGPHDRAFQQHLINNGVYPDCYEYPDGKSPPQPDNLSDILDVLTRRRPSLSQSRFPDSEFRQIKRAMTQASKEWQLTSNVIPIIGGGFNNTRSVAGQVPFTNLDHLTDGSLVAGNPDQYYGARTEQLDQRVWAELSGHIVPSTQHDLPIVPNFFLAVKGPDGSPVVAERQACYDGALGARGMRSLQTYRNDTGHDFDNKAYTITCAYHSGQLKIYTSHILPSASPGRSHEYITTQIKAYALTSDIETFRAGAAAYRNARDWAKLQRDEAIAKANEKVALDGSDASPPRSKKLKLESPRNLDAAAAAAQEDLAYGHESCRGGWDA
ncbi:hypothetical protein F4808DRAFT_408629 [Astrocystis sublimbata]|nr:hypothetical protein F4808DRAFT_408629 [Astrocystis sublimbata]